MLSVLSLDLDGTLIRKGLDDIFWNELVPELFAESRKMPVPSKIRKMTIMTTSNAFFLRKSMED